MLDKESLELKASDLPAGEYWVKKTQAICCILEKFYHYESALGVLDEKLSLIPTSGEE